MTLEYRQIARDGNALTSRPPGASGRAGDQALWVVGLIFGLMTLLCPFDDAVSLPLGELSTETYVAVALLSAPAVLSLMIVTRRFQLPWDLTVILILIVLTILASLAANLPDILSAVTKGRRGLEKAISSSLVLMLGMYVSIFARNVVPHNFLRYFLTPVLIGSIAVAGVALLQVAAIYSDSLQGLSHIIVALTHTGLGGNKLDAVRSTASAGGTGEVSSVLFEPADFGTYVIYVTPWLLAALLSFETNYGRTIPVVWKKLAIAAILVALFVSIFFSGRTAKIGMPIMMVGYIGLCFIAWLSFHRLLTRIMSWLVMLAAIAAYTLPILLIMLYKDQFVAMVVSTASESNITRFGTAVILLDLFGDHPFFGVGMGQYGFHVAQYVPYWAYTYEFHRWLGNLNSSFFPSFAVFARLGGELGMFGLVTWIGFLVVMLNRVFGQLRVSYFSNGRFPYFGLAIVADFFSIGVSGMGMASYRIFWLWATLGLASIYAIDPLCIDAKPTAKATPKPSAVRGGARFSGASFRPS